MSDSTQHRQVVAACTLLLASYASVAQTTPDAGSLLRESERQQPRLPQSVPKVAAQEKPPADASAVRIQVKAFRITGNTLIAEPQLQKALLPWVGKESSFTELQQATSAIAEVYRQRGWFARVQLLPQDVSSGTITIAVLESKLGEIRIDDGGKQLRMQRDLVTDTMTERQKPGDPLNLDALERSSNILNDTPGVVVATILASGKTAGDTDAVVKVQDKPLVSTSVQLDNTGSRSTGDKKLSAGLTLDNPSGTGDQISLNANGGEGNLYAKLAYSLPVGRDGLRVGVSASGLGYKLVGPDFEALASKGDGQTFGANASYPLMRSGNRNIGLAAALDRKTYYNEANGLASSQKTIYAGLLSVTGDLLDGLGAGGMTLWGANITLGNTDLSGNATNQTADQNGPNTAGGYAKLGYNLARLQRLSENTTLWFAFNGQTAFKNLDSSEKMSLGGPSGVRAYPVMEGTGDKGWLATLEGRYNLTSDVQLVAFYDHGSIQRDFDASYTGALLPATADLKGAGVAVGWSRPGQFTLRATLARRIGDNPLSTPATGLDQDGSLTQTRFWLSLTVPLEFGGSGWGSGAAKAASATPAAPATAPATYAAAAPAPTAPVTTAAPVVATAPALATPPAKVAIAPAAPATAAVLTTLERWLQAWADRNVEAYLSHYAADFRPEPPLKSRKAWLAQRKSRLAAARGISIDMLDPQISLQAGQAAEATQATAVFTQRYSSKQHSDVVRKTLTLQRTGDAWRIVSETQTKLP